MFTSKTKSYNNISVEEFKTHLDIDPSDSYYDNAVKRLIKVAVNEAERFISKDIVPTVCVVEDYNISNICYRVWDANISVNGITGVTDNANTVITGYSIKKFSNYTLIEFASNVNADKLLISYNSGYATVPVDIVHALKLQVGYYFDADKNGFVPTNFTRSKAFDRLLSPYQLTTF